MNDRSRLMRFFLLILTGLAVLFMNLSAVAQQAAVSRPVVQNPHGELQNECTECHSAEGWKPAKVSKEFKHAPKTFPLIGAHATAKCMSCHTSLDFKHASTRCADCHKDVHRGELGADCGRCHTPRNFLDRTVMQKLHQTTRFALTGAHLMADCQSCHAPLAQGHLSFINVPTECGACHLPAYQATASMAGIPNHAAVGFSTQCEQCHVTVAWSNAAYNHAASGFALTGAHVHVACTACHQTGYTNTQATCGSVNCHLANYNATTAPVHSTTGFDITLCTTCHSTTAWQPSLWKHIATWAYYTGAHPSQPCVACHSKGVYAGLSTQCVDCHGNHHGGTNRTQCQDCHGTNGFGG